MKIFVAHSSNYDFKKELYEPLRRSSLNVEHEIFLPHEKGLEATITKDIVGSSDLVIAEVSYPSTGQGIELGWANVANVPIICIYKEGSKPSGAINIITNNFIVYKDTGEMIDKLTDYIFKFKK